MEAVTGYAKKGGWRKSSRCQQERGISFSDLLDRVDTVIINNTLLIYKFLKKI